MTWAHDYTVLSGMNGDAKLLPSAGANVAINSGWIDCDLTANGNVGSMTFSIGGSLGTNSAVRFGSSNGLYVMTGEFALSGSPTAEVDLLCALNGTTPVNRLVRFNTSKQMVFYDKNGALLGTSSTVFSTSKASPTKAMLLFDVGITDASLVYIWLVIGGTEDATIKGFNTGLTPTDWIDQTYFIDRIGMRCPSGSNPGVTLSFRKVVFEHSADNADHPHSSAYPDLTVVGGQINLPPTAESSFNFTNSTTASPNTWQDIDDVPTDADTSRIWDSQTTDPKTAHDAYYTYSAANPLTSSDTVRAVQFVYYADLLGASKTFGVHQIKVGTSVAQHSGTGPTPANGTYAAYIAQYDQNPSTGVGWIWSAFAPGTIKFGMESTVTSGIDCGLEVTTICGPEVVKYSAFLSTLSAPSGTVPAVTQRQRGVVV